MKAFEILSGKAMIVEMPDGAPTPDVINTGQPHLSWLDIDINLPDIDLPPGNWRIIGMLSEVTEAQCRELVDEAESGYKGYIPNSRLTYKGCALGMSAFGHAWKSLLSAIFAAGYYLDENPYQPPTPKMWQTDQIMYMRMEKDYTAAQSRVLSRERCLLLRRVDG